MHVPLVLSVAHVTLPHDVLPLHGAQAVDGFVSVFGGLGLPRVLLKKI
ncbi:MAG: hypothetical protein K6G80_09515 [Treponema sp.]|nr:hypothetical protein [Treponema sp.]